MHTVRSAPPLPVHWKLLREDKRLRNGSQSPPMGKRPSDGWPRRILTPVRYTRSRKENILPQCGGRDPTSPSRSGGALCTNEVAGNEEAELGQARSRRARWPRGGMARIFGPGASSLNPASQIDREPQAGDLREMGGGSTKGWRPDLQQNTESRKTRGQTAPLLGAPRG